MIHNKKDTSTVKLEEDYYEEDGIFYVPFNEYDQPVLPKSHMDLLPSEDEIESMIEKEMRKRGKI